MSERFQCKTAFCGGIVGFFGFAMNFFKAVWAEKKRATKSSGQFALMAA